LALASSATATKRARCDTCATCDTQRAIQDARCNTQQRTQQGAAQNGDRSSAQSRCRRARQRRRTGARERPRESDLRGCESTW
jgi:hypothetical protein